MVPTLLRLAQEYDKQDCKLVGRHPDPLEPQYLIEFADGHQGAAHEIELFADICDVGYSEFDYLAAANSLAIDHFPATRSRSGDLSSLAPETETETTGKKIKTTKTKVKAIKPTKEKTVAEERTAQ